MAGRRSTADPSRPAPARPRTAYGCDRPRSNTAVLSRRHAAENSVHPPVGAIVRRRRSRTGPKKRGDLEPSSTRHLELRASLPAAVRIAR